MKRVYIVLALLKAVDGKEEYHYTSQHTNPLFLNEDGTRREFSSQTEILQVIQDNNTLAEADKLPKGTKRPEVFAGEIIIQEVLEF
jgi:hypothetical protein